MTFAATNRFSHAVARWLVWRPEIERRFCDGRIWVTLGKEGADAITVISDCVGQLDPTLKTKATVKAASDDLATLLQDRSVLFVIDDVWPGESAEVAKALMVPSPRSRFLLTTRFPELADDHEIRAEDFPLDEMSVGQAAELIFRALGRKLSAAEQLHAEQLCEIVGGHPLALELAAAHIKEGRPWKALLDDLSAEIARLEALEKKDDDLIAVPISGETRKKRKSVRASLLLSVRYLNRPGQRLFAWLGVVAEEAIITSRMAATLWSEEEETARGHLRTLNGAGLLSAKGDGYSIHDLMHDLARKLLTAPEAPTRAGDIPGFGLTLRGAMEEFLERYRAKRSNDLWHTLPVDGYIHDHLIRHLEQAGRERDLEGLLWEESADGRCGWYQARERLGQTAGFLGDVGRVWGYADRLGTAAASDELRARAIALQLHCVLIIASINSLSASIPLEVLVGAVKCGTLSLPSALALARQRPGPRLRVAVLLALENEIQRSREPSVLGEALSAARGIGDAGELAEALAEIAQRLPEEERPSVLREALRAARGIDDAESRAEVLVEIAQRLSAEEALGVARGIDDANLRVRALVEVGQGLPEEEQARVLDEALNTARDIDDEVPRAWALAEVAQRLPAEEAREIARGIGDICARARGQVTTAQGLRREKAMAVARCSDRALAGIARQLPADEALAVARSIGDAGARARALAEVAQRLPTEEALGVARGIDDANLRVRALVEVGQGLPEEEQARVLDEALNTARDIDDEVPRAWALAEVAQRLPAEERPEVLREALSAVSAIDDAKLRARALVEVALALPEEEQPSVVTEALSAASGIDDAQSRAEALAEVAQWLPAEEALTVAHGIGDASARARALAKVAQRLPTEEALAVAHGIGDAGARARALAEVAQRLPTEEALAVARSIGDAGARARALAEVALQLPTEEALAVARGIGDPGACARALAEISQRLPVEEALTVARGIDDPWPRAWVLAEVEKRLPAKEQWRVLREALSAASSRRATSASAPASHPALYCIPRTVRSASRSTPGCSPAGSR